MNNDTVPLRSANNFKVCRHLLLHHDSHFGPTRLPVPPTLRNEVYCASSLSSFRRHLATRVHTGAGMFYRRDRSSRKLQDLPVARDWLAREYYGTLSANTRRLERGAPLSLFIRRLALLALLLE